MDLGLGKLGDLKPTGADTTWYLVRATQTSGSTPYIDATDVGTASIKIMHVQAPLRVQLILAVSRQEHSALPYNPMPTPRLCGTTVPVYLGRTPVQRLHLIHPECYKDVFGNAADFTQDTLATRVL